MDKSKCLVTIRSEKIVDYNGDILYIEDYETLGSVHEAKLFTDQVFLDPDNKKFIEKYDYDGYKITWAWYDSIYVNVGLVYSQIKELLHKLEVYDEIELHHIDRKKAKVIKLYLFDRDIITTESIKKISFYTKFKLFVTNSIMLIFSLFSILYSSLFKRNAIAIWSGDLVYKDKDADFRYLNLYEKLHKDKAVFMEFFRPSSFKNFIVNTLKRKRGGIYYFSFIYFIEKFIKTEKDTPVNFYHNVLLEYTQSNQAMLKTIPLLKIIMRMVNVKSLFAAAFISRNAHVILAAKSLGVRVVGTMHAMSSEDYTAYELLEIYDEEKMIGVDYFNTYSDYFLRKFQEKCKIVPKYHLVSSGLLVSYGGVVMGDTLFEQINKEVIKILFICDPLVDVQESLPYIKKIVEDDRFKVAFKVRPMVKDLFYEELVKYYPKVKELQKYDGNIFEDAKQADICLGARSTAVLEAALVNKLTVLIDSEKWGDYHHAKDLGIVIDDPKMLIEHIQYRIKNEINNKSIQKVKERYFGGNRDGTVWIYKMLCNEGGNI